MGSMYNMNEEPAGTPNPQFKVKFTKEFKKLGLEFNFRIRRSPNHDMWQPLFCSVSEEGIDWSYGWNSDNIFVYMGYARSWHNVIEIEAGELACQIQFEYEDNTTSEIYDIGKFDHNDVQIKLYDKKVKTLIIHEPSARQYDELLYGTEAMVGFNDLIPGKEYCEVRVWTTLWRVDDGDKRPWVRNRREEDNKKIQEKYPDFLTDNNKDTHNINTDGQRFSKRRVEILSVGASPSISNGEVENRIEFREPSIYMSYDVEYGTKNHDFYDSINGYDRDRVGEYNERGGYDVYFVDVYNSGKRSKKQQKKLEAEFKITRDRMVDLQKYLYAHFIKELKANRKKQDVKTFNIGGIEWTAPIVMKEKTLFNFYYQMLPYIPQGFKLPTIEQLSVLTKHFSKHDVNKKVNVYKDKNVSLEVPMLGTQNPNGSNYDIGKHLAVWTDLGDYKPVTYQVIVSKLYHSGIMREVQVNHDRDFAAGLLLVKE